MTVSLAVQVLSRKMFDSIERVQAKEKHVGGLPVEKLGKLKEMVRLMNAFFDLMNGKVDKGIVTPENADVFTNGLLETLQFFSKWKNSTNQTTADVQAKIGTNVNCQI